MVGPTSSESSDQMPCNITSIRSCSSRSSAQLATSEPHRIDAPRLQLTIFTGASCWPFSSLLVVRILLRIRTNCLYHSWVFDPRLWFFRLSMPSYLKRPIVAEAAEGERDPLAVPPRLLDAHGGREPQPAGGAQSQVQGEAGE